MLLSVLFVDSRSAVAMISLKALLVKLVLHLNGTDRRCRKICFREIEGKHKNNHTIDKLNKIGNLVQDLGFTEGGERQLKALISVSFIESRSFTAVEAFQSESDSESTKPCAGYGVHRGGGATTEGALQALRSQEKRRNQGASVPRISSYIRIYTLIYDSG